MTSKEEGKTRVEAMAGAAGGSGDPRYPPSLPPPLPPLQFQYQQQQYQYGTFGTPGYSQPGIGFPQHAPPGGIAVPSTSPYPPPLPPRISVPPYRAGPQYFAHGYHTIQGYAAVAEGTPLRMPRLPCFGIGIGWFLFILGFFLAAVPWYVGAFFLLCARIDYREKPGFIACTVAAIIAAVAIMFGATNRTSMAVS